LSNTQVISTLKAPPAYRARESKFLRENSRCESRLNIIKLHGETVTMTSSRTIDCRFAGRDHRQALRAQWLRVLAALIAIGMTGSSQSILLAQLPWAASPATPAALPNQGLAIQANALGSAAGKWDSLQPPPRTGPASAGAIAPSNAMNSSTVYSGGGLGASTTTNLQESLGASNGTSIGFPPLPGTAFQQQSLAGPGGPPLSSQPTTPPNFQPGNFQTSASFVSTATPGVNGSADSTAQEFDQGDLIAVVGTEHILAGDMMIFIEPIIEQNRSRITPAQEKQLRATLIRQVLSQYVQIKALYQEFFRDMAGTKPPKEIESMKEQVTTKAGQIFFEKQVPQMMKKYKVNDAAALDKALREKSMSVSAYRTQFIERILSSELERKYVPEEYEFSREELLAYYHAHPEEWTVNGRARWRELCVRFNKHPREEAEKLIRDMGNQVYLGGKPFEAVAKEMSEGFTASAGGVFDWTTQGSLKSTALDTAIFSLPLRRLSLVIEDDAGFHIIEVLEREDGHTKSFDLAQVDIRKKLSEEKRSKLLKEFHNKVMARTPIWTKWPEDIPGSRDISEALGNDQ
jgi:hypothetical protein